MAVRTPLRILCFGDSLTSGFSGFGASYHPYWAALKAAIGKELPELEVEIVEDGVPGDRVQGGFFRRIKKNFEDNQRFDWTIVLGGTNDLASNVRPEDVFVELERVWNLALLNKSKVLAMTVPEVGATGLAGTVIADRQTKFNTLIKEYQRENFHVFDLHAAVPYFAMSKDDRKRYWDDLVHFTPDGYDLLGQKLGAAFVPLLSRYSAKDTPPSGTVA